MWSFAARTLRSTALRPALAPCSSGAPHAARAGIATTSSSRASGLDLFVDPWRSLSEDKQKEDVIGREWQARELRLKSFDDLHALWYVLLRERNMLQTEKYLARANRVQPRAAHRIGKVRRTMSRIKHVLSERAIEDAGDDWKKRKQFMDIINAR
jgi:large subunit ribosomal protein L47